MSFLQKTIVSISGISKTVVTKARQLNGSIPMDLMTLERVQPGLATLALDYINGSGSSMVLSTLSQKGGSMGVGRQVFTRDNPDIVARRCYITDPQSDTGRVARYVEVLTATLQGSRNNMRDLPTTDNTLLEVQVLLAEMALGYGERNPKRDEKPLPDLPADKVMEIITRLGGSAEDLFDVIFYNDTQYSSGRGIYLAKHMDLASLARAYPEAFVAQNRRLPLQGRQQLFEFIALHSLGAEPQLDQMVIEAMGDGAKTIREAALKAFTKIDQLEREAKAIELLEKGNANMRSSMIEVLIAIGNETSRAKLTECLKSEKTARNRAMIEGFLEVMDRESSSNTGQMDGKAGYQSLDGEFITIPPSRQPEDGPLPDVTTEARARLLELAQELENDYQKDLLADKKTYYLKYATSLDPQEFLPFAEKILQGEDGALKLAPKEAIRRINLDKTKKIITALRSNYPLKKALELDFADLQRNHFEAWSVRRKLTEIILKFLEQDENADLRFIDATLTRLEMTVSFNRQPTPTKRQGELLGLIFLKFLNSGGSVWDGNFDDFRFDAVWPMVAENLSIVDRALGLVNDPDFPEDKMAALRMLETLPALPAQYGPCLLNLVMTETKSISKRAEGMLRRNKGYESHLVKMIDDTRQDVRARVAKWLGEIGHSDAKVPLQKRLKKERSPLVQAAILSALQVLGLDISAHISPDALLKEAQKGLKKANFKDVSWLDLTILPQVHYHCNRPVPQEVLQWWIALAIKLKAPGETALFDLYLDQLRPEDAVTLSSWIFDVWYGYDTAPPSEERVEIQALQTFNQIKRYWDSYFPESSDLSDEQKLEILRRRARAETPNSGAKSKGLLALAGKVPPTQAVAKVRSYLRKHGGRTSQAISLLELMASKGDAMSLQVVIAAATRLRQKGVQAKANEMVQMVADRNDWTADQLADRTVPTGGVDDDGKLELACSGGDKLYVARLDEKLGLTLFNPIGKIVKSLPSGGDDETKAARKALSAAKKEIKQAVGFQSNRMFEAMCCGREWQVEDWKRDFHAHPLMRKLIERLIWQGLDQEGHLNATFRPTAEGEFINVLDEDVEISECTTLRLAHASTLTEEEAASWRKHMSDFEIKMLFDQIREELPRLTPEMKGLTEINDRMGWVYDAFTLRGEASRAGYERGDALDGGGFDCYTRHFGGVSIVAVIEFTGNHVQQENIPAAIKSLFFEKLPAGQSRGYGTGRKLRLDKLPPVLLAECWADLHSIAQKANFDREWEKVCPW